MARQSFYWDIQNQRRTSRQAFSLVELLVVIAVLAVLAALLLPALGQGKAQARRTQCLSQLQQWSKALLMYVDDNDDAIPRRGQGVRPLTQLSRPEDWFNALPPVLNLPGFGSYIASAGTNANSPPPGISGINLSGTDIVLACMNEATGGKYYALTSTNLALPLNQWTPVTTNVLNGSGNFSVMITNVVECERSVIAVFHSPDTVVSSGWNYLSELAVEINSSRLAKSWDINPCSKPSGMSDWL